MRVTSSTIVLASLALAGCDVSPFAGLGSGSTFGTVEAACGSAAPTGDPDASQAQIDGLWRLNCHRRLAGLPEASLDPLLNRSAQAHADYMLATGEYGHEQSDPGHPSWTGTTAEDRAAAAGYALDTSGDQLAEVIGFRSEGADAVFAVDNWINTVYHREPLLVPQLGAIGFGEAGIYDVMELVAPWSDPQVELAIYPARGQSDVPTTFDSDTETPDPVPDAGLVGPPITVSVLADGWTADHDPYALTVVSASLVTTAGTAVPVTVRTPAEDPWLMRMVALIPLEPLTGSTTYEVEVTLAVAGVERVESWAFATRAAEDAE